MRLSAVFVAAVLLTFFPAQAQLRSVGLQNDEIVSITAEQGDPGEQWFPYTANALFAATKTGMVYQGLTWDDGKSWTPIGPFVDPPYDIVTMTVQHWGAGPRDGLHLMTSIRPGTVAGSPVLLRHEVSMFGDVDSVWTRADSGLVRGDTMPMLSALAATYYTGHTIPQPVLAWTEDGPWCGWPAGNFWEEVSGVGGKVVSMDVTPKWFGTDVWAAGVTQDGVGDAAVYRSKDAGLSWEAFVFPRALASMAYAVAVAPGHPDTAYASIDGSVRRTLDGGASWEQVYSPPIGKVIALACDPSNPTHIYAGSDDSEFSLQRSTDLGESWQRIMPAEDQHPAAITCMTVALLDTVPVGPPARRGLFIGTAGTGVWLYEMDSKPSSLESMPVPEGTRIRVYPNPTYAQATVEVTVGAPRTLLLEMRDLLGRRVWSMDAGMVSAGSHQFSLPVADLPAGAYLILGAEVSVQFRLIR
ncbi:MAG: hypothetical protein IH600_00395 [Bacteroidetes bacterium]|nr:hypothetical protein [Bacteroidota bacterium]